MRCFSSFILLSFVATAACSHTERKHQSFAKADSAASLGPRADSPATDVAASDPPTAASAEGNGAETGAPALPVVDAAALLQKIRDSGQRGVVVNIWASWCDPCRNELPMLARVAPQLAKKKVPIWLVSVDNPEGFAAAKALLDSLHIDLPAFAAAPPLSDFKLGMNPKWPGMIPVSFLFDKAGKLRYFWPGEVYEKELIPIVEGFVAGKQIDGTASFGLAPGATQGPGH